MERPTRLMFIGGILFLMAAGFLVLGGLSFAGRVGDVGEMAMIPASRLRRMQIAGLVSGVLNAGVLILAGAGVLYRAGWSRALGLVLGFWVGLIALVGLLWGGGHPASVLWLLAAAVLTGMLLTPWAKDALSLAEPRPRGVTVLGVLYFVQAMLMIAVGNALVVWNAMAGIILLAVVVSVSLWVGAGLLDLRSWARRWTLVVAGFTVGIVVLGWVVLLARNPSDDAVGAYIARSLITLPVSVFALWYLNRGHVKDRFLRTA